MQTEIRSQPEALKISDGRDFGYSSLNTNTWVYGRMLSASLQEATGDGQFFEINSDNFVRGWGRHQEWMGSLNLAQYLGLPSTSALARLPSWCVTYPWASIGPHQMKRWLPRRISKIRRDSGFKVPRFWSARKTMEFEAKVSPHAQASQFQRLMTSIAHSGFWVSRNASDPLTVDKLKDGSTECWVINSGFHRTCAATAIGMTELPAEVRLVVDRSQVHLWSQVRNGSFTESEALSVFDSLVAAKCLPQTDALLRSMDSV